MNVIVIFVLKITNGGRGCVTYHLALLCRMLEDGVSVQRRSRVFYTGIYFLSCDIS